MKNRIRGFLKANWVNFIVFVFVFMGAFLLLTSQWIKIHFGDNVVRDFGAILFIIQFPMLGNGVPLIASFFIFVVLIAFCIAFCIAWINLSIRFIKFIYASIDKISPSKITTFRVIFAIVLFALCTNIVINRFRIKDFLNAQTQYSQLYEEHYKYFDFANLKNFTPKQNLIVIFVESLETNLSQVTQKFVKVGGVILSPI